MFAGQQKYVYPTFISIIETSFYRSCKRTVLFV